MKSEAGLLSRRAGATLSLFPSNTSKAEFNMADGKIQMDDPSSQKAAPSSHTDFDVPSRDAPPFRDDSEGEDTKEKDLGDKPQGDLTAEDLKGDNRGKQ